MNNWMGDPFLIRFPLPFHQASTSEVCGHSALILHRLIWNEEAREKQKFRKAVSVLKDI